MKVLLDQGVPIPLRDFIPLEVSTCYEMNWATLSNGDLLAKAESHFDIFVTTDKNIRYQQNLTERTIAIYVLPTTQWPKLKPHATTIGISISEISSGEYFEWKMLE
jgi:hypothetical protein